MICPDCKGKKMYVGLNRIDTCRGCQGKGEVADYGWGKASILEAASKAADVAIIGSPMTIPGKAPPSWPPFYPSMVPASLSAAEFNKLCAAFPPGTLIPPLLRNLDAKDLLEFLARQCPKQCPNGCRYCGWNYASNIYLAGSPSYAGHEARVSGETRRDNPYSLGTTSAAQWEVARRRAMP